MALTAYLTLEGKNQGKMEGDCKQKGREKTILVYATDHTVEIPRDKFTGLPTGQRIHQPFIITKHTDPASPLMFQALTTGEQMKTWQLEYYHIDEKGQEKNYYEITLENAVIVQMREYKPNTLDDAMSNYHDMEEVSFTYSGITWTNKEANKEASDDWMQPKSS